MDRAFRKLVNRLLCAQLRTKIHELERKMASASDEVEKLKIEAMIEIINSVYKSECEGK